jgi:hypothetical protein
MEFLYAARAAAVQVCPRFCRVGDLPHLEQVAFLHMSVWFRRVLAAVDVVVLSLILFSRTEGSFWMIVSGEVLESVVGGRQQK